jgi:hypothetical protein
VDGTPVHSAIEEHVEAADVLDKIEHADGGKGDSSKDNAPPRR